MGGDARVPKLDIQNFGYMYLANTEGSADQLRRNQIVQKNVGAATQLMSGEAITRTYPFYNVDDIFWVQSIGLTKDTGMALQYSIGGDANRESAA